MPFMPEMLAFCGRRFRVEARAHKTCDTVRNIGGVRLKSAVHLEGVRCDGAAHGGCQAACLMFWKEQWLRPVSGRAATNASAGRPSTTLQATLPDSWSVKGADEQGNTVYRCQITELPQYTTPVRWWDVRQYVEDLTSGNIGLGKLIRGLRFSLLRAIAHTGIGYRALVKVYNAYQKMRGGSSWPWVTGTLDKTPDLRLHLASGERVRVKKFEEILATLDTKNKNRGLGFDTCEMRLHCGKEYEVERHVHRIIDERSGKMMHFGNPCVVLKDVYCTGETTQTRLFCPRAITPYWREIWLERIATDRTAPG
jgi:hypothetical protein